MALKVKKLNYKIVNINPGLGQMEIFQKSGQRKVPILIDGSNIISDSHNIILHLEKTRNIPSLFPEETKEAALAHIIENWADTTFAKGARNALLQAVSENNELRKLLLPESMPNNVQKIVGALPLELLGNINEIFNRKERSDLLESLLKIGSMLNKSQWLVGDRLSIADIAIAAQLYLIKFSSEAGEELEGMGCPGFYDDPRLESLFQWRDQLEMSLIDAS